MPTHHRHHQAHAAGQGAADEPPAAQPAPPDPPAQNEAEPEPPDVPPDQGDDPDLEEEEGAAAEDADPNNGAQGEKEWNVEMFKHLNKKKRQRRVIHVQIKSSKMP